LVVVINGTKVLRCSSYFESIPETITRNTPTIADLQVVDDGSSSSSSTEIADGGYEVVDAYGNVGDGGKLMDATTMKMIMMVMMMIMMMMIL